jgi:signal transduction histidine kinase
MASPNAILSLSREATEAKRQDIRCDVLHARKMAALGELTCGVTHDFRNILQTLLSVLDVIDSRSDDPDEVRRLTAAALRASERGIALTNRILKFSRPEAVQTRAACLLPSLDSVMETLGRTVGTRINVQVESAPSDLWWTLIDPVEFELALINLGINARDAMPKGGHIRLSARNVTIPLVERRIPQLRLPLEPSDQRGSRLALPGGDYVAVTVGDTGSGMDKATLARAVEPFFTTKPVGKGTGLGLSIVHNLATEAGGAFRLMSRPGGGTKAEVWLPRAQTLMATTPQLCLAG